MNVTLRTDRFRRGLLWLGVSFEEAVSGGLHEASGHMVALTHATSAFKDATGETRRSFQSRTVSRFKTRFVARPNARRLNDGTPPHTIEARTAKVLRFVSNGGIVFRRRVNHPGTKPTHFLDVARDQSADFLRETLLRRVNDAIRHGR